MAQNGYSLNYSEYLEVEEEKFNFDNIEVKTLGDIFTILPKSKRNAKYGKEKGLYPFFKSSLIVNKFVDKPDYIKESIIIGDGGNPNVNYGIKFSTSDHCYIFQNKNEKLICLKFVYYYLFHNLNVIENLFTGVAIKNVSKNKLKNIKIPIPPSKFKKILWNN